MYILLKADAKKRYIKYLEAFESRYNRLAKASERFEAYQCAIKNKLPSWCYF